MKYVQQTKVLKLCNSVSEVQYCVQALETISIGKFEKPFCIRCAKEQVSDLQE